MEVQIYKDGKSNGTANLPDELFAVAKVNKHLVHEVVRAYLQNQRKGTQSTLTRSEVSGGGRKPWKQKHTGRARSGSTRSPLWRHGGIIHAPKPRSYRTDLPGSKIRVALTHALSAQALAGNVIVSELPALKQAKTKLVSEWLKKLSFPRKTLVVVDKRDENFVVASKNIPDFEWVEYKHLHPYHILNAKKIVLTPEAVKSL